MTRKRYQDGQWVEIQGLTPEAKAAAVHDDTLKTPLRHPVSGRVHDSKSSYMRDCEERGERVVGNDWVGTKPEGPRDRITDALIMEKIKKAEAIMRDPAKRRERMHLNMKMTDHNQRFMKKGKI